MDEEETKSCPNCKREIPTVNFTIHSVHCARNIKICPVCKEPVPTADLDKHHQMMHKLLPCKQCGESVCGTDLEDHIRDSCANTVKTCRYCELELPRRELPTHEGYCGVRTEQCPDCQEYVMIKYQQLHLDSNHGFIRLDDDPAPPKKEPPKSNHIFKPLSKTNISPSNSPKVNNVQRPTSLFDEFSRPPIGARRNNSSNTGIDNPSSNSRHLSEVLTKPDSVPRSSSSSTDIGSPDSRTSAHNSKNGSSNDGSISSNCETSPLRAPNPRRNPFNEDQNYPRPPPTSADSLYSSINLSGSSNSRPGSTIPSLDSSNLESSSPNNSSKPDLSNSSPGSPNTRQSSSNTKQSSSNPGPSSSKIRPYSSNTRPSNDIAGHSKISNTNNIRYISRNEVRNQGSSNVGDGATSYNTGPPEVPPAVVRTGGVKKRTNDQPQINKDTSAVKTVEKDLGAVSRGAVKKRPAPQPPRAPRRDLPYYSAVHRQQCEERDRREQNEYNRAHGLPPVLNPAQKIEKLRRLDALQNRDYEEEYRARQRRPSPEPVYHQDLGQDFEGHRLGGFQDMNEARQDFRNLKPMSPTQFMRRFSSLQVAPAPAQAGDRFPQIKSSLMELRRGLNEVIAPYNANSNAAANNNNDGARSVSPPLLAEEVRLPCEFCDLLVPAEDLVQHQTGCRPDLARLVRGAPRSPSPGAAPPRAFAHPLADPVIPCEFCMRSLPVYLISEHQEQCGQDNMAV